MAVVGLILFLLIAVTAFVVQNQDAVSVRFFGWIYQTQLGLAMIAAAVVGGVIIYVSALLRHRELRGQIRGAEARLREAEQKALSSTEQTESVPRP